MALVVYGVMRRDDCPARFRVARSGGSVAVKSIAHDGVCALVGATADGPVRVRREGLLAHSDVLSAAMRHGPVLPMRFGVVLPDEETVRQELLEPSAPSFTRKLQALDGTAEFQLKATFDSERVLTSFLASDEGLASLAASIKRLGPAGHFDRIRLGELIAERVDERAGQIQAEILAALEPVAGAAQVGERNHEWMAANIAFLVADGRRGDFDEAVDRLAITHAGDIQFRLIGPLPPHSFTELVED